MPAPLVLAPFAAILAKLFVGYVITRIIALLLISVVVFTGLTYFLEDLFNIAQSMINQIDPSIYPWIAHFGVIDLLYIMFYGMTLALEIKIVRGLARKLSFGVAPQ